MVEHDNLRVETVDGVGRIVIDRPDHHNALDAQTARALRSAVADRGRAANVRCLVLTGTGDAFNTGADLSTFAADASDADRLDAIAAPLHDTIRELTTTQVPVVIGVNGVAAGGGIGLALAGDVVLMADDARFEYAYPSIGLSGDGGATFFLPRLLGLRRAQSFAFLADPIDAEEAASRNLVTEVVPADAFEDRVADVASTLSDGPTRAYARLRRLFFESYDRTLHQQLTAERDQLTRLAFTEDYARGVAAFLEGEEPAFEGR